MTRIGAILTLLLLLPVATTRAQPQSDLRTPVGAWVSAHQPQIVKELIDLLSIPNVASDRANIRRNAEHLRGMLKSRGFKAELLETSGNPLVYGELVVPGATRTLLLYSHYDGQPVDPKAWKQADPFVPVLRTTRVDRGGTEIPLVPVPARFEPEWRLYARSAADDKSPIVAICAALDALAASALTPTWNVRVILDGEEEASSPSLVPAIAKYREKLRADAMVILDGPIHSSGRPTVAYGARGIVTLNLTVFGPRAGVHSGNYGNWVPNPAERLAALLATMKADDGRVLVAGFNDGIAPLTPEERAMVDAVPDDSSDMLKTFGIAAPSKAFPRLQDALQYPTLNVRGLLSAHVGAGARTIVPDRATAAMDIRLVKETSPARMIDKLRAHVLAQGYHFVDVEPTDADRATYSKLAAIAVSTSPTNAFRTPPSDAMAKRVVDGITREWGAPPVQLRTLGGTVPIAPFIEALGFPAILVPTVNFDNNQHEENENLRLGHLFQAIEIVAAILRS
jgi:acetylornithine deacetylase/succinyl-diaminopimelate desuccinylase-like protein